MFCKESLEKIKFRAFPQQVHKSLESIDYFGTRQLIVNTTVVKKKEESELAELQWWGVVNIHLCVNGSCDEHAMKLCAMSITFLISGNDLIFLESRPLSFRVFIHMYSLQLQRYF